MSSSAGLLRAIEGVQNKMSVAFAVGGSAAAGAPAPLGALEVEGESLPLPLSAADAARLRGLCERAPFGRGLDTVVDTAVRDAWQVDGARVRLPAGWEQWAAGLARSAAQALGVPSQVEARLYKLVLYAEGGKFTKHRDAEKEDGMFGTLVLQLPTADGHAGGALEVSQFGRTERFLFDGGASKAGAHFAAFFADCEHELTPVLRGHRLVVIFNLVAVPAAAVARPRQLLPSAALTDAVRAWEAAEDDPPLRVLPLSHKYTDASLSFAALKSSDRAVVEALRGIEDKEGVPLLCVELFTLRKTDEGTADCDDYYGGYGRRWYDEEDEAEPSSYSMLEVYDSHTQYDFVAPPNDEAVEPEIDEVGLDEALLGTSEEEFLGEVDEEDFEPGTGNAGPTLTYTYRTVGVVFWLRARSSEVLSEAEMSTVLLLTLRRARSKAALRKAFQVGLMAAPSPVLLAQLADTERALADGGEAPLSTAKALELLRSASALDRPAADLVRLVRAVGVATAGPVLAERVADVEADKRRDGANPAASRYYDSAAHSHAYERRALSTSAELAACEPDISAAVGEAALRRLEGASARTSAVVKTVALKNLFPLMVRHRARAELFLRAFESHHAALDAALELLAVPAHRVAIADPASEDARAIYDALVRRSLDGYPGKNRLVEDLRELGLINTVRAVSALSSARTALDLAHHCHSKLAHQLNQGGVITLLRALLEPHAEAFRALKWPSQAEREASAARSWSRKPAEPDKMADDVLLVHALRDDGLLGAVLEAVAARSGGLWLLLDSDAVRAAVSQAEAPALRRALAGGQLSRLIRKYEAAPKPVFSWALGAAAARACRHPDVQAFMRSEAEQLQFHSPTSLPHARRWGAKRESEYGARVRSTPLGRGRGASCILVKRRERFEEHFKRRVQAWRRNRNKVRELRALLALVEPDPPMPPLEPVPASSPPLAPRGSNKRKQARDGDIVLINLTGMEEEEKEDEEKEEGDEGGEEPDAKRVKPAPADGEDPVLLPLL